MIYECVVYGRSLTEALIKKLNLKKDEAKTKYIIQSFKWLGTFSEKPVVQKNTLLDALCSILEEKCMYKDGERDIVLLQHRFEIETKEGKKVFLKIQMNYSCKEKIQCI